MNHNAAATMRGVRDLHAWIGSRYLDLPPEETRHGRLSRLTAMWNAGRILLTQAALEPILAIKDGHKPEDLPVSAFTLAIDRYLDFPESEEPFGPPIPELEPIPTEELPAGWRRLRDELDRFEHERKLVGCIGDDPDYRPDPRFV